MAKNWTKRISRHLVSARAQHMGPWGWIVDETRDAECVHVWNNSAAFVRTVKRRARRDHWAYQPVLGAILSEQSTVKDTGAPGLDAYGVTVRPWHGYVRATKAPELAGEMQSRQQPMSLLYLGDGEPSGLAMSALEAPGRLVESGSGAGFAWKRMALTEELRRTPDLPGCDVDPKQQGRRDTWSRGRHGARAWELDALRPNVWRTVVEPAIRQDIAMDPWEQSRLVERAEIDSRPQISQRWTNEP